MKRVQIRLYSNWLINEIMIAKKNKRFSHYLLERLVDKK